MKYVPSSIGPPVPTGTTALGLFSSTMAGALFAIMGHPPPVPLVAEVLPTLLAAPPEPPLELLESPPAPFEDAVLLLLLLLLAPPAPELVAAVLELAVAALELAVAVLELVVPSLEPLLQATNR